MTIFKIKLLLSIVAAFLLISCSTSRRMEKNLSKQSEDQGFFTGVYAVDAESGKEIINFQGDKYFTPASNVKLFTLYASLKNLKDSVPSYEYCISGDSLILRGAGDPNFLNDSLHENSINFLSSTEYNIYLLDKDLNDANYGPGWSWEDYAYAYMPEKSLMPLYGNTVKIVNDKNGLKVEPSFFTNHVQLVEKPTKARDLNKNSFYIGSSNSDVTKRVPFKTSNQLVADLLSEKLGTKVTLIAHNFKREFIPFNEVPYDSLYVKMMKASDNFIAEQLLLQVGNKTVQQYNTPLAIKYVLDGSLAEIPDRPRWVDGSGLSRYNLFSPRSMVFILSKLYHEVPKDKLISYFPQVGMEGTLKNNFKEQPYVHAKSGTLSNNYSLSGYLTTKKGTVLIFSYMNNHYTGSSNKRKKEMAVFFKELYESF